MSSVIVIFDVVEVEDKVGVLPAADFGGDEEGLVVWVQLL